MKKISCVIPAYNEEHRIGNVLDAVVPLIGTELYEVIVVDDASKDKTIEVVSRFANVTLITYPVNGGKSHAVCLGADVAQGDHILLLDADLVGITSQNIVDLIHPINIDTADITISLRGNAPKFWKMIGLDYISGERVMPKEMLIAHKEKILQLTPFGLEVYLNSVIIHKKFSIGVILWENVSSPYKYKKYGMWKGITSDIKMMSDIFQTITLLGAVRQIVALLRSRTDVSKQFPKVSLIVIAYNEEKNIRDCLYEAIKNADDALFEILVVDNASTDRTKVEATIGDVRIVYEPRKGITSARQRGYLESRGEVLAYIDADTRMPRGWVHRIRNEFKKNHELATLSGPYIYYDLPGLQKFLVTLYWNLLGFTMYLCTGYMVVGGNFAIRKTVLEKMNGFDTSIEFYGEDTNIARRAHSFGKTKFSLSFRMYTSGRRLEHEGFFKTGFVYAANFLSEVILKRPAHSNHNDIR